MNKKIMLNTIEDMEKQQLSETTSGGLVGKTTCESQMTLLEQSKMHIARFLAIPLLGISPRDIHTCRRRCVQECLSQQFVLQ